MSAFGWAGRRIHDQIDAGPYYVCVVLNAYHRNLENAMFNKKN